jgi:anaerobic sulfite reductase subunit A
MSYILSTEEADAVLSELKKVYRIYAPKRFSRQGRYSDTDIVRYAEINSFGEIEFDKKSDFPAKEVLSPIQRALFYFTEEEYRENMGEVKPVLVLGRACDINAQKIQARIYDGNGGYSDPYYKRLHDAVKFILLECESGTDTCFCVSMGTNKTDDYVMAVRKNDDGLSVEVKDGAFENYFTGKKTCDFRPKFVEKNELSVKPPVIPNKEVLTALKNHPMWREFDKRCISCGSCTVACSTCTCFTTRDIVYTENQQAGERRRVTDSCQIAGFDQMAGQKEIRSRAGDRMRYKVLHKFHDYDARFHEGNMCVGCGRCIDRCPEFISIAATVEKMNKALEEITAKQEVKS